MPVLRLSALVAALVLPVAAFAYDYTQFEPSVTHIDLSECPEGAVENTDKEVFCRLTIGNDALHIYVFEQGGDMPLVAVRSYEEGQFTLSFNGQ
ncbi:MAG: hypothetical protein Q4G24_03680 [Paracoccus sp. (in: a-proteobacteria)]|uniref:hypothetical protein n=1 Tax=Paracoccus sp. TaxID=267 RepID=UPI0026DF9341|nr:hypothetical protein [Paracoccus sp. (in: a-proteobacteria)]MDO5620551.1 hypothetical protein [Paracoccus sp. (in: a-proteobacteria)]